MSEPNATSLTTELVARSLYWPTTLDSGCNRDGCAGVDCGAGREKLRKDDEKVRRQSNRKMSVSLLGMYGLRFMPETGLLLFRRMDTCMGYISRICGLRCRAFGAHGE